MASQAVRDFIGMALYSGVPPGHVERCPSATGNHSQKGTRGSERVEEQSQDMKAHGHSVHRPGPRQASFLISIAFGEPFRPFPALP